MALIVETGQSIAGADSYVTVAEADAYHAARGSAVWPGSMSETDREQLLRRATDNMSEKYYSSWSGYRISQYQPLDWPRSGMTFAGYPVAIDAIPDQIKRAQMELAIRAIDGPLTIDQTQRVVMKKTGPLEREYAPGSTPQTRYSQVDQLLSPFLKGGGGITVVI